eukprot:TRINITY_DN7544_c0_g1_i1.p1 TRINITY_DN7544_c0_g1~~TRINITY_DN7544_c0_g1_i1.p1  ORF type:complete len:128 (+),score=19.97 TRINITY_DN7544_c0_g1_i1:166-549(+)
MRASFDRIGQGRREYSKSNEEFTKAGNAYSKDIADLKEKYNTKLAAHSEKLEEAQECLNAFLSSMKKLQLGKDERIKAELNKLRKLYETLKGDTVLSDANEELPKGDTGSYNTVSYTHLTLPTICSV